MNPKKQYKLFKALRISKEITKSFSFLKSFIIIVQALSVMILMLRTMQDQLQNSGGFISQIISAVNRYVLTYTVAQIMSIMGLVSICLLNIISFIRANLIPAEDQLIKHKKILKIITMVSVLLANFVQMFAYVIFWSYFQIQKKHGLLPFILLSIVPMLSYTYFNAKFQTISLYKAYTIPIVFQLVVVQNAFSYLIIIAISSYLILIRKQLLQKILLGLQIIIAVFVLKNSQLFEITEGSQMKNPIICLSILILILPVMIFKLKQILSIDKQEQKVQDCFIMLMELKGTIPYSQLKFNEFYELYKTIFSLTLSSKQQKDQQLQVILQKRPQDLTKQNFLILLQKYLQKQCKKISSDHILKQILLLKIKMALNYPMTVLIQELYIVYEQLQRSQGKYQIEFFSLYDDIIKKYGIFKNGVLQPAHITHLNQLHEKFQNKINAFIEKLYYFWQLFKEQQVHRTLLDERFAQILEMQHQIEQIYKSMERIGAFEKQKQIIHILRTFLNAYEDERKASSAQVKKMNQNSENQNSHSFIIIENKFVKFISKDLLKSLDEDGGIAFQNIDKKTLFGEQFSSIIDQRIKNLNCKNQNEQFMVPIFCKKGFMQLKKIKIMWFPTLQTKNRYLFKFLQTYDLQTDAHLIYHCKTDTIKYFNKKFIEHFNIDQQKLEYQISNYEIFFNELFINSDVPVQEIKNILNQQHALRCKLFIKKYLPPGIQPLIPVQIKSLSCIEINKQPVYRILKINKLKQKKPILQKKFSALEQDIRMTYNKDQKVLNSNEQMLLKKFQNQKFFCKIPNHYQSKITQKQAQLDESGRWVYRYFIHILFGIAFTSILTFWTLDYTFVSERIKSYNKYNVALQNVSEQYALLYQSYSVMLKKYYGQKFPKDILITKKIPSFVYNQIYVGVQQTFLNEFITRYLTQINQQPNINIPYNINFSYFSIETDTDKSTLMDYAQNFKRNIATNQVDFLLRNYDNFRNLTIKYENSFKYDQDISAITDSYAIYLWILMSSTVVSLIVILYTLYKIQSGIQLIYDVFNMISKQQFREIIYKFKLKRRNLTKLFYMKKQQIKNQSYQAVSTIGSNYTVSKSSIYEQQTSSDQISRQKLSLNLQKQKQNKKNQKDNKTFQNLYQNSIDQKITLLDQKIQLNKQNSIKKIIDQNLITKLSRKFFFILCLILLNVVFYIDYQDLMQQRDGIIQIFDIKRKLYTSLLRVKRQEVDAPMVPTMNYYFNTTLGDIYHSQNMDLIPQIQNDVILSYFKTFINDARYAMTDSMCSNLQGFQRLALKPCVNYLNGTVTNGFSQTYDIYVSNAKKLITQKMSQFGPYPCTVQKCPIYLQHEFVSIMIGQNVRMVILLLNKSINGFFDQKLNLVKIHTLYKIMGLFLIGILYIYVDKKLKKRCKRSIRYFKIIPKGVICTMKITTFMKRNKVLNKFDIL